jgi:FkbM family methyltransferase
MDFVRDTLSSLGLYRQGRMLRNRYLRPELGRRADRWRRFYSEFIAPGDLVFDVGANQGDRTELFVQMGARVVAVEPNQALATRLESIFRRSRVKVEAVGVGSKPGELPFYVCTASACSSFSPEFVQSQRKQNSGFQWDRTETIAIITMDTLVEKHGTPAFIKIDVEGFEVEVLAGLSHPVRGLSFEVRPDDSPETTDGCFDALARLGRYEFNLSIEERLTFELPRWDSAPAVLGAIRRVETGEWKYADVYARKSSS